MTQFYILQGKKPIPAVGDATEWASHHRVAWTRTGNIVISTVFLGVDYAVDCGPPLLFETMIFGGRHEGYQRHYSTWEEAEKGHEYAVSLAETPEAEELEE